MTADRSHAAAPPYDAIVFDCDSTLSEIEGIDELCRGLGADARQRLEQLTNDAMNGALPLEAVYGERLELARPSARAIAEVANEYARRALPGAARVVAALRWLGKRVAVVSGGVTPAVRPFALRLGVDGAEIHAVDLRFDSDGQYSGFDAKSPLARAGGKPAILREHFAGARVALVGDGATDAEAAPHTARFIAFTAVASRPAVVRAADAVVDQPDLAALLPHLLTEDELDALRSHPDHTELVTRGAQAARPELWIPGPTYVRPALLAECAHPMVGHRSEEVRELIASLDAPLERAFGLATGSGSKVAVHSCTASGALEAGMRALGRDARPARVLVLESGAFGARLGDIAASLGHDVVRLSRPAGEGFQASDVDAALARGGTFDAVAFVASETSTGAATPPERLAPAFRAHPEVLVLADVVTWFAAAPVDLDAHGLDLAVAGTQKALALPPGLSVLAASQRFLERAATAQHAGWFLDLARIFEAHQRQAPPMTPTLPLLRALAQQLRDIEGRELEPSLSAQPAEGWPARFERHARMSAATRARGAELGLDSVPSAADASPTVSCLACADPATLRAGLRRRGFEIGSGYGELKGTTIRIGHLGDHSEARLAALLDALTGAAGLLRQSTRPRLA